MERKKLVLLSSRSEIADMYYHDLQELFYDHLELFSYTLERTADSSDEADRLLAGADILLLTNPAYFEVVRGRISETCRVIHLDYAFQKEKIELLERFPEHTTGLVCFRSHAVSTQVVKLLRGLGLDNLQLDAYDPASTPSTARYDLAIIGDNSADIPLHLEQVVSLGMRKLSFPTLLAIANTAGFFNEQMERRFGAYCQDLFTPMDHLLGFYHSSFSSRIQLKTIMNCVDYAILICDKDYHILDFNSSVNTMYQTKRQLAGYQVMDLPIFRDLVEPLGSGEALNNSLVKLFNGKSVLLSVETVDSHFGKQSLKIILMKDITKIQNLQQSFTKQLAQRGHVTKYSFADIAGESPELCGCVQKARVISGIDKPVLLVGESGTGKELFSQSIHAHSARSSYPFVAVNCAALPTALLESELFGYAEGAFTGAQKGGRIGLFETANHGTLFLDEIGEISLDTQAKLLRVLEEREIMRVGGGEVISVDVRIIAATNKNLHHMVQEGKFRLDLYYRLNMLILRIPPLRDRPSDIPLLTGRLLSELGMEHKKVDGALMDFLKAFPWPGNIRELKNTVEYMSFMSGDTITMEHLPEYIFEEWDGEPPQALSVGLGILGLDDKALSADILRSLARRCAGRRALLEELRAKYPSLSEYRLRAVLRVLTESDLLLCGKGRAGLSLSDAGRRAVSAL